MGLLLAANPLFWTRGWLTAGVHDWIDLVVGFGTVIVGVGTIWAICLASRGLRLSREASLHAHDREVLKEVLEYSLRDDVRHTAHSFRHVAWAWIRLLDRESQGRLDVTLLFFEPNSERLKQRVEARAKEPSPVNRNWALAQWDAPGDDPDAPSGRLVIDVVYDELVKAIGAVVGLPGSPGELSRWSQGSDGQPG